MYEKAIVRLMLIMAISLLAGCAPTYAPDLDAPPTTSAFKMAPLDPPPQLPDADQSPCPSGSGLAACFTSAQDNVRQNRFRILHDDRDYCRDAYERVVNRAAGN
jgi:hypothetical protein